ncbi:MAG: phenylalanine 4-monooxygenase [Saprospiraceae bacterium]
MEAKQIYANYKSEDFLVWKTLFGRQMNNLEGNICGEYLNALETIGFTEERIPNFDEIDSILASRTGWSLTVVSNIAPLRDFFGYLSQKKFTATTWLRKMSQLDYIEEPDMFHDVFGHVPLLANKSYTDFFRGLADIALEHLDHPVALEHLGRIYWFTIEFGLISEEDKMKIYGAGIISSFGETRHCLTENVEILPFDISRMVNTPYRNDLIQDKYFVIDSYQQLYQSLPDIRKEIERIALIR